MTDATVESRLRKYLDNESTLYADNYLLTAFHSWQRQVLQSVQIEPIDRIAEVRKLIDKTEQSNPFELNRCYENAFQISISSASGPGVKYVEGFVVVNNFLYGHAWNSIDGQHFDHTTNMADDQLVQLGIPIPKRHFFKVIELSAEEAFPLNLLSDGDASMQTFYFLNAVGLSPSTFSGFDLIPKSEYLP